VLELRYAERSIILACSVVLTNSRVCHFSFLSTNSSNSWNQIKVPQCASTVPICEQAGGNEQASLFCEIVYSVYVALLLYVGPSVLQYQDTNGYEHGK